MGIWTATNVLAKCTMLAQTVKNTVKTMAPRVLVTPQVAIVNPDGQDYCVTSTVTMASIISLTTKNANVTRGGLGIIVIIWWMVVGPTGLPGPTVLLTLLLTRPSLEHAPVPNLLNSLVAPIVPDIAWKRTAVQSMAASVLGQSGRCAVAFVWTHTG
ncbi:hypothetical protein DPMN_186408 [Dreissena polymorpha]|uniref:Uncharacterized protein n=1 Tax=Dreissena polymorpha TaxID=45954 RepID=A0A9D4DLH6_DREPO|nr:hypothetical protein DPMN_186408 [Dreissena polymorpha]